MEIVIPTPMSFEFASATNSPFVSAPSTPKRFGSDFYFSAPTSPTHLSEFYREFDNFAMWAEEEEEEIVDDSGGCPKSPPQEGNGFEDDDFAFDFSHDLENKTLPAEVLFDGGKIRQSKETLHIPASPIKRIRQALSPRKKQKKPPLTTRDHEEEIGRAPSPTWRGRNRRQARSLSPSPYRVPEYHPWEGEQQKQTSSNIPKEAALLTATSSSTQGGGSSSSSSSRKWRLKDLFLFRSASEGRGTDKDPLKKYTGLFKKHEEDVRNSSFRSSSTDQGGGGGGGGGYSNSGSTTGSSSSRRGPPISPHELHYTVNRAVSEDLKKKTFLPYKQGILGRLAFNPTLHALTNGFGFSTK